MSIFKLGFALIATFLGGIAAFVGAAVTYLALKSGEISVSMTQGASAVGHVARRASEPQQFWNDLTWFGLVPLVVGSIVAWFSWRSLKG
ncbi:MAG: hypothetical protein ABL898_08640 [Hyphomicrobiaceae bacterium]|nr:hypothetical protein [Hyphomicrobiaceae bacterium]